MSLTFVEKNLYFCLVKPSLGKRIRRSVRHEFRRIRDELRSSGPRRHRPPLRHRIRHWWRKIRERGVRFKRRRPTRPPGPPLTKRLKYFFKGLWGQYRVVLSFRYRVIALNSTVLFLVSFFLVHFCTHLITGLAAWYSGISTTLNYTMVDFHIRYWEWTPEMVIIVFTAPALFALAVALLSALAFARRRDWKHIFRRMKFMTRKQKARHRREERRKMLELQVQRLQSGQEGEERTRRRRRLTWRTRLFLLWTLYHSLTYFFSGLLFSFLFHRRFGYVTWYAFDNFLFDVFFSFIAFVSMLVIGYAYAPQFFQSGKLYFARLGHSNRMPFALSQAFIPFFLGTVVTTAAQLPAFDPSLVLLNLSLFFFLLPIASRSVTFGSLSFGQEDPPARVWWGWIGWAVAVVAGILVAVRIGIPINFK